MTYHISEMYKMLQDWDIGNVPNNKRISCSLINEITEVPKNEMKCIFKFHTVALHWGVLKIHKIIQQGKT